MRWSGRGGCRRRFRARAFEFGVVAVGKVVALGVEQAYLAVVGVRSGEQVELFVGDEKGKVAVLRSRIRRGETFAGGYVSIGGVIAAVEVFHPDAFGRFEVGDGFALLTLHVPDGKIEMDAQAGLSVLRNIVLQPDPVDGGRSGQDFGGTPQAEDRQDNGAKKMLHGGRGMRMGVCVCPGIPTQCGKPPGEVKDTECREENGVFFAGNGRFFPQGKGGEDALRFFKSRQFVTFAGRGQEVLPGKKYGNDKSNKGIRLRGSPCAVQLRRRVFQYSRAFLSPVRHGQGRADLGPRTSQERCMPKVPRAIFPVPWPARGWA